MTPKERKERLFKKSRPNVRRLEILDGEQYSNDFRILWAAYKAGSFNMPEEMSQTDFVKVMESDLGRFEKVWVVDDANKSFRDGKGPVALICTNSLGLVIEPSSVFFKWATKRNILRCSVAFINMLRYSTKTGICMVRCPKSLRKLPDHLRGYDMLHYVGKAADNEYLYSVRGRASD